MDEENWIAAQSARDALAPRRWERRNVAQHLADMIRDGVVPARCQRLVHTCGGQTTELENVVLNDEVRALMRRADGLSWSCQTLDLGSMSFFYSTSEPRRDRFALSSSSVRHSIHIYGLELLKSRVPGLSSLVENVDRERAGNSDPEHAAAHSSNCASLPFPPPPLVRRGRGRPPKWDWPGAEAALADYDSMNDIYAEVIASTMPQAVLERWMTEWFSARNNGEAPVEAEVRKRVTRLIQARREYNEAGK